jgi:hypothetical protein
LGLLAALLVGAAASLHVGAAPPPDTTPPTVSSSLSPLPNAAGWNKADVLVTINASDGGSGIASLTYTATGANPATGSGTINSGGKAAAASFTVTKEGTTNVSYNATDGVGNSASGSTTVKLDKTAPTATPSSPSNNAFVKGTVNLQATASDSTGSGVASVVFFVDGASKGAGSLSGSNWLFALDTTTLSDGSHTWAVQATDIAGNTGSTSSSRTIKVDNTGPSLADATVTPAPNSSGWETSSIDITFSASDGTGSGVASITYSYPGISGGPQTVSGATAQVGNFAQQGTTTFTYYATDAVGNQSASKTLQVKIDTDPPVITQGATVGTLGNLDGSTQWYTSNVTVNFSASDAVSGLAKAGDASFQLKATIEGSAVSTGSKTVQDKAGNASQAGPLTFAVDKTPPSLSASAARPPDKNDWYTSPVEWTFSATYSGPDSDTAVVTGSAADKAGNTTSQSFTFKYDATAPVVTISGVSEGAYVRSVTLNAAASDPGRPSAVLVTSAKLDNSAVVLPLVLDSDSWEGSHTFVATAQDEAGNVGQATVTFTIDRTAPAINFDSNSPADGGIYNVPKTLAYGLFDLDPEASFSLQKLFSQLALQDSTVDPISSPYPVTDEGQHQVDLMAVDRAGNPASLGRSFLIDMHSPVTSSSLTGTLGNPGWFKGIGGVTVNLLSTDPYIRKNVPGWADVPGSGVQSLTLSVGDTQTTVDAILGVASTQFSVTKEGETTITFHATDRAGNDEAEQRPIENRTIVVRYDNTPPVLTVPANIIAEATGPNGAVVSFTPPSATDNVITVDGYPLVEYVIPNGGAKPHLSGDTFPLGTTLIEYTATDAAGNSVTQCFAVTVQDTTPPTLHDVPQNKTVTATGPDGAPVTFDTPTAIDLVDGNVPVILTKEDGVAVHSGDTFPLGDTTITVSATDSHGKTAIAYFIITVEDKFPPTVSYKAEPAPNANGWNKSDVTVTISAEDHESGVKQIVYSLDGAQQGPSTIFPGASKTFTIDTEGETTITYQAEDYAGNTSGEKTLTIKLDKTAPVITAGDVLAEATGPSGAVVDFQAIVSDNLDTNVQPSYSQAPGSTFPVGDTKVTITATDQAGNTATKEITVSVVDTTPPTITVPEDIVKEATGPDGAAVTFSISATDLVDGNITPTASPASGSTFPLGTTTVTVTAEDAHHNPANKTFTVKVQDTTAPVISGVPDRLSLTATSSSGAPLVLPTPKPSALDIVDGSVVVNSSVPEGAICPLGKSTVTFTATDNHGNKATKTCEVTVTYAWSGFLPPINAAGTRSSFKLGSTVPVKFQLTGASAGITNAVAKFSYGKVDNTADAVNEVAYTDPPSTGNLFRYDPTSNQYIYNWGTKGLTVGTYMIKVDLGDGVNNRTVQLDLR